MQLSNQKDIHAPPNLSRASHGFTASAGNLFLPFPIAFLLFSFFARGVVSTLFTDQHLPRRRKITRSQRAKIDAIRHGLPLPIPPVPIRGARSTLIHAGRLAPNCKRPNRMSLIVMNRHRDLSRHFQSVRYPRLRIERIRVVWQKCGGCRNQRRN